MKTYDVRRDPGGLTVKCPETDKWLPGREDYVKGRSYKEEIKADLVNEMIKTFSNGLSTENK